MWDKLLEWFTGEPKRYRDCNKNGTGTRHPFWARDARMRLLPEEEGMDFYEECTLCGKEFR